MSATPHRGIPVPGCNCLGCDAVRELHEQARTELDREMHLVQWGDATTSIEGPEDLVEILTDGVSR